MKILPLLILPFALFSCGNETKSPSEKKTDSPVISGVYEGMIGDNLEIVLSAETQDEKISGSYFYRKIGTDILISGKQNGDQFEFSETAADGKVTGNFSGRIFSNGDSLSGEWKNPEGTKTFAVHLKRSDDPAMAKIRIKWHYFICKQKTDPDAPDEQPYMEGYEYPEISGLENQTLQDKLNAEFYPKEIDDNRRSSDYASVKEVSEKEYNKVEWPNGHITTTVSIDYYDSRVITWSKSNEFDGGAHPSFGFFGMNSVFLATGKTVSVNDILQGEWKKAFLEAISNSTEMNEWIGETDDPCGHIRDTLLAQVSKWNGSEPVYPTGNGLTIIIDDYRSFSCPEIARGIFEISLDWQHLKPFLKPGNPLEIPKK